MSNGEHFQSPECTLPNLSIAVRAADRLAFYSGGRPLKINDIGMRTLDIIAGSGQKGVTQSEVAKRLCIDSRSFFHQLKSLLEFKLVARIPVSYQKTFTYLLYLPVFLPQDDLIPVPAAGSEAVHAEAILKPVPSLTDVRSRIMDILQSAPSRTLSSVEVYRLLGVPAHVKIYRRNVSWLVENGFIECFVADELGGVVGRILKYKKPLTDVVRRAAKKGATDLLSRGVYCGEVLRGISLEKQIHDFIDRSGPKGVTLSEMMWAFGLGRKLAYRITERLIDGKFVSGSEIIKVPEFVGKERRHRLFTKTGKIKVQQGEDEEELAVPGSANRDSITRSRRMRALVEIVQEAVFIESGKALVSILQKRLNENDYMMDSKTLKRMVQHLEAEGKIRSITLVLPNNLHKTILTKPEISPDDPRILEYIENLQRQRIELGPHREPPTLDVETGNEGLRREHKFHMQKQGYVYGVLQRCRLLHEYIIERHVWPRQTTESGEAWLVETLPVFFRQLTVGDFLKIIGVGEMSTELSLFISNGHNTALKLEDLPVKIKNELHRRRADRHKGVVKKLMDLLSQLGLAFSDNRYPSIAFRLPYQYRVAKSASVLDLGTGAVLKAIDLTCRERLDEYWDWLSRQAGVADTVSPSLPNVYTLAIRKESWQVVSPFSRALRQSLRRLLLNKDQLSREEFAQEVEKMAGDFDTEKDLIANALVDLDAEQEKERVRRSEEKRASRQNLHRRTASIRPAVVVDNENSGTESEGGDVRQRKAIMTSYSLAELESLRLAFLILQQPQFRHSTGNLQWSLIEHLYHAGVVGDGGLRPSEEFRAMFQRLLLSFDQNQKIRHVEWRYRYLLAAVKSGRIEPLVVEGEQPQESLFEQTYVYFANLMGQVDRIKQEVRERQRGVDVSALFGKMIIIDEECSVVDPEPHVKKMTRTQQIRYFFDKPPIIHPEPVVKSTEFELEWRAIKKTLAVSVPEYDAVEAQRYLEQFEPARLETAVLEMVEFGLLAKGGDSSRFRRRIPGGEYLVSEKFQFLLEEHGWPLLEKSDMERREVRAGDRIDIVSTLRLALREEIDLTFEMQSRSNPKITIELSPDHGSVKDRLDVAMQEYLEKATDRSLVWFSLEGRFQRVISVNCCRLVLEEISSRPGTSWSSLCNSQYPFMCSDEVSAVLDVLMRAQLIEQESGGLRCYYPLN